MGASLDPYIYAVDAGGSRTSVSISSGSREVTRWITESFAIASVGADKAIASLARIMGEIRGVIPDGAAAVGCISTSSMPVAEEAPPPEALIEILAYQAPPGRLVLVNDVIPLLWSPELSGVGVVVSSGTGSSVVGRDSSGRATKVGGHEHILSDQGSAYSLARKALRAAARDADGTGQARRLRASAEAFFERSLPALGRWLAELPRARPTVARVAPMVTAAAADGDEAACDIVRGEADYLALATRVACSQLDLGDRPGLGLAGGVLRGSDHFRDVLHHSLAEWGVTDKSGANMFVLDGVACARHYAVLRPAGSSAQRAALTDGLGGLALRIEARRG
jgi:N-acetylglucosamine kinase-like BadF-type ATPase